MPSCGSYGFVIPWLLVMSKALCLLLAIREDISTGMDIYIVSSATRIFEVCE